MYDIPTRKILFSSSDSTVVEDIKLIKSWEQESESRLMVSFLMMCYYVLPVSSYITALYLKCLLSSIILYWLLTGSRYISVN